MSEMQFDSKSHKVKWWLINKDQAIAFLLFLESEKIRHAEDITEIERLSVEVKHWFKLE